jgi:hypothetical protein
MTATVVFPFTSATIRYASHKGDGYAGDALATLGLDLGLEDEMRIGMHADIVKRAYREMSVLHHPDKHDGDQNAFVDVTSARDAAMYWIDMANKGESRYAFPEKGLTKDLFDYGTGKAETRKQRREREAKEATAHAHEYIKDQFVDEPFDWISDWARFFYGDIYDDWLQDARRDWRLYLFSFPVDHYFFFFLQFTKTVLTLRKDLAYRYGQDTPFHMGVLVSCISDFVSIQFYAT